MLKYIFILCLLVFCNPISDHYYSIHKPSKIVLITVDGTRWQDIFDGETSRKLLPNIYHYFVDNGMAIGKASEAKTANFAHISMPGYIEILSGKPTMCLTNYCEPNKEPTIFDEFKNNAAMFGSWDTLRKTFDNNGVVVNVGKDYRNNEWQTLNLPDQKIFPENIGDDEYREDAYTIMAVKRYLSKLKQPDLLWVGLGDTDEYAHSNNKEAYLQSLRQADTFIGELISKLDKDTTFIVNPDHGRSNDNWQNHGMDAASGKVFILLYGANIPSKGFVKYDRTVYLSDIKPTILDLAKNMKSEKSLINN